MTEKNPLFLCLLLCMNLKGIHSCDLEFNNLNATITVESSLSVGDLIFTLTTNDDQRHAAIVLVTESKYFELNPADRRKVVVRSCLPAGHTEILKFSLENKVSDNEHGILTINVSPVLPVFDIPSELTVPVGGHSRIVDILRVEFSNTGECTLFQCNVTCNNDEKHFWIETGTFLIRTFARDLSYDFEYHLEVTCTESRSNVVIPASVNNMFYVSVVFTDTNSTLNNTIDIMMDSPTDDSLTFKEHGDLLIVNENNDQYGFSADDPEMAMFENDTVVLNRQRRAVSTATPTFASNLGYTAIRIKPRCFCSSNFPRLGPNGFFIRKYRPVKVTQVTVLSVSTTAPTTDDVSTPETTTDSSTVESTSTETTSSSTTKLSSTVTSTESSTVESTSTETTPSSTTKLSSTVTSTESTTTSSTKLTTSLETSAAATTKLTSTSEPSTTTTKKSTITSEPSTTTTTKLPTTSRTSTIQTTLLKTSSEPSTAASTKLKITSEPLTTTTKKSTITSKLSTATTSNMQPTSEHLTSQTTTLTAAPESSTVATTELTTSLEPSTITRTKLTAMSKASTATTTTSSTSSQSSTTLTSTPTTNSEPSTVATMTMSTESDAANKKPMTISDLSTATTIKSTSTSTSATTTSDTPTDISTNKLTIFESAKTATKLTTTLGHSTVATTKFTTIKKPTTKSASGTKMTIATSMNVTITPDSLIPGSSFSTSVKSHSTIDSSTEAMISARTNEPFIGSATTVPTGQGTVSTTPAKSDAPQASYTQEMTQTSQAQATTDMLYAETPKPGLFDDLTNMVAIISGGGITAIGACGMILYKLVLQRQCRSPAVGTSSCPNADDDDLGDIGTEDPIGSTSSTGNLITSGDGGDSGLTPVGS